MQHLKHFWIPVENIITTSETQFINARQAEWNAGFSDYVVTDLFGGKYKLTPTGKSDLIYTADIIAVQGPFGPKDEWAHAVANCIYSDDKVTLLMMEIDF